MGIISKINRTFLLIWMNQIHHCIMSAHLSFLSSYICNRSENRVTDFVIYIGAHLWYTVEKQRRILCYLNKSAPISGGCGRKML